MNRKLKTWQGGWAALLLNVPLLAQACVLPAPHDWFFSHLDRDRNGITLHEWQHHGLKAGADYTRDWRAAAIDAHASIVRYADTLFVLNFQPGSRSDFRRLDRNRNGRLERDEQDWFALIRYGLNGPCQKGQQP
ncbi:hypothetical protein [Neisseria shayeganii]|uniref:EF-hand domain-containing protein n=1 Tax=Neisseria shayeganii 871 TaxID=1032488 RepID=G4CKX4_9NEIS|nr:hypothetical protein [Neisseria shayeganii]EGY51539.1 hypothetical protein HMPREF9371_2265 [Neisseria shayeganii 871]